MKKEEKIKELENRQTELKDKFGKIISQSISDESIREAETTGVDIITESINNDIMLDILNWDDDRYARWVLLGMESNKQKEEQIMDTMCQQLQMEVNASETQKYYKSKEVQDLDNPTDVVDEYESI